VQAVAAVAQFLLLLVAPRGGGLTIARGVAENGAQCTVNKWLATTRPACQRSSVESI
jgi:hypothetical protein